MYVRGEGEVWRQGMGLSGGGKIVLNFSSLLCRYVWIYPYHSHLCGWEQELVQKLRCCNFTDEDVAIVQEALRGSIILSHSCSMHPKGADDSPQCSLPCLEGACGHNYLKDAITLSARAGHSYLIHKAESLGQSVPNISFDAEDAGAMRSHLLRQAFCGCTGFVQFNSRCSRVSNLAAIYNFVPVSSHGGIRLENPWKIENRAFIFTTPENYNIEFWHPNGSRSIRSTLVFYDGTQNIPLDEIPRPYYRGNENSIVYHHVYCLILFAE